MVDITLFAKSEKNLETLIQAEKICSQGIVIEFGREKCAMLTIRNKKQPMMEGIELPNQERIRTEKNKLTST